MANAHRNSARIASDLLTTKLVLPTLHPNVIQRPDLLARLDQGLSKKLTMVTAPTGFGKTTLVVSWITARNFTHAWVALDESENDPNRFWIYLITALRSIDASVGKAALSALRTSPMVPAQSVLTSLINDLARLSTTSVLVLEDFHLITSPEIQNSFAFFLQHLPPALHLVLISRSEPLFSVAIYWARDEVTELNADHLRFNLAETEAFFEATVQPPPAPSVTAKIFTQTQGWVGGLRLAASSLQNQDDQSGADGFLRSVSDMQRHITEYLIEEVLKKQPEEVQVFLLRTCFLNRLTGALCDAVTETENGAALLERLERQNLFILKLSSEGSRAWYRYYPLFAESIQEFVRRSLGEKEISSILEKASEWYEKNGSIDEAIEAALAAKQYERSLSLMEAFSKFNNLGVVYSLSRWLAQIPGEQILLHPRMSFIFAQVTLYTSDRFSPATMARVEPFVQAAETAWRAANDLEMLGELHSFEGIAAWWRGDLRKAFAFAHQALTELPEQDLMFRGNALLILTYEALNEGRIVDAQDYALETRALLGAAQNIYGVLAAMQMLSAIFYWQGDLEQAEQVNRQILADADDAALGESMLDDQGTAALGIANRAYEQNDLEAAKTWAARAQEKGQQRGNEALLAQSTICLSRIQLARGEREQAGAWLASLAARVTNPTWRRLVEDEQALFSIRGNDARAVQGWLAQMAAENLDHLFAVENERRTLILARLRLLEGKPAPALEALEGRIDDAQKHGRVRSRVEALILKALAHYASRDMDQAAESITQALKTGEEKGFRRLFLDEGEKMAALLQSVLPRLSNRALKLYAATLLHSFPAGETAVSGTAEAGVLIEPLSHQELRVLRLLDSGLSNMEIASELVVSRNTIKTQVQSIYRKLNVNSRAEVRQVAHELKLL